RTIYRDSSGRQTRAKEVEYSKDNSRLKVTIKDADNRTLHVLTALNQQDISPNVRVESTTYTSGKRETVSQDVKREDGRWVTSDGAVVKLPQAVEFDALMFGARPPTRRP